MEEIGHSELLAATRFVFWSSILWVGAAYGASAIHQFLKNLDRQALKLCIFIALLCLGVGLQQWFWWAHEIGISWGNCTSHDPLVYNAEYCAWVAWWRSQSWITHFPMWMAIIGAGLGTKIWIKGIHPWLGQPRYFFTWWPLLILAVWLVGLGFSTREG
jgi:hypothetical protein